MTTANASLYTDFQGVAELKAKARTDASGSLDQVAKQFESLFTQMMIKSMRQAKLAEGLMDSDQTKFYQDMYDQQLSIHLAEGKGLGLTDVIKRQLGGSKAANDSAPVNSFGKYRNEVISMLERSSNMPISMQDGKPIIALGQNQMVAGTRISMQHAIPESVMGPLALSNSKAGKVAQPLINPKPELQSQQHVVTTNPKNWSKTDFVQQLWPWAREAADRLGVAPAALLAQAALETGWGRHVMPSGKGKGDSAFNLFGIKTGRRWKGESVNIGTLEYEQGVAVRKKDRFRAYQSFGDSFNDYVDFLQSNPRYSKALASTSDSRTFFHELQKAGYATDPRYAAKLTSVLEGKDMQQALQRLKDGGERSL
ncbi:MAG: flagellar assembly peptidoglycan hydrolase FlgJ [Gammaproteobacteria bacterium]|nr:flagellar assembly peptidoglycan hydrolase FlgJ [Gammaproteobacteria bacterium]